MAFSDLQLKVASETAVVTADRNLAKINLFAKSFSELDGKFGDTIAVPVYNFTSAVAFDENNNYGSGDNEVTGANVVLDQHYVKPVSITDSQLAFTGINWIRDTTKATTNKITKAVNDYVFGLVNETNCPLSADVTLNTKTAVANLYKVASDNDLAVDQTVVSLTPENYATVLGLIGDTSIYGTDSAIRYGIIDGLFGFRGFICGKVDALIDVEALGVASRYLAPEEGAYPQAWKAVTEDGFSIGFRVFTDLNTGSRKFACDCLFGAKVLQSNKIVRLV